VCEHQTIAVAAFAQRRDDLVAAFAGAEDVEAVAIHASERPEREHSLDGVEIGAIADVGNLDGLRPHARLRYRLGRFEELSGRSLSNTEDRVETWWALQLR
jgi:hypothetical protein